MTAPHYKIEFTRSALKEYDRLEKNLQNKILDAMQMLAINPRAEILDIKKIKGAHDLYRLRLGDYRIVYHIRGHELVVIVIHVGHRKDVYRKL